VATELPDDWKPGRTVVVLPSTLCGPKDTPWAGVGGTEGVCADEDEGVGTGVVLVGGCTGCWGVGSGDCQAEGDPGVGVGEPGGVLAAGRAGKSSFWDGLRGPGNAGNSSFCCGALPVVLVTGFWVVLVVVVEVVLMPNPKPGRPVPAPGAGPPP